MLASLWQTPSLRSLLLSKFGYSGPEQTDNT